MGEMKYRWAEFLMKAIYKSQGFDVIHNGAPDLILLKDGKIQFVEIKCKKDKLKEEQKHAIALLKKHGFTARRETVTCFENKLDPGYHKIRVFTRGVGNNRTYDKLSEWVRRIVDK